MIWLSGRRSLVRFLARDFAILKLFSSQKSDLPPPLTNVRQMLVKRQIRGWKHVQALASKLLFEIFHSPENLHPLPLGPNSRRLHIGSVHSVDTCCWSDMDGPNSLPDSNSSGSKTESNIWREQLLFAELAPSIFRTFNLMRGLRASVGFHFKSTPSREIFKFSNRLK